MLNRVIQRLAGRLAHYGSKLRADAVGATAIEYALIAGLIGLAIIAGVTQIGASLQSVFNALGNAFPH